MKPASSPNPVPTQLVSAARARLMDVETEMTTLSQRKAEIDASLARLIDESSHLSALLIAYEPETTRPVVLLSTVASTLTLADHVVELLTARGEPMHYREIERELRRRGLFAGTGRDPANALLATYYNDERLVRPARGTYAVKRPGGRVESVGKRKPVSVSATERRTHA